MGLAGEELRRRLLTWGNTNSSLVCEEPGPGCEALTEERPHCQSTIFEKKVNKGPSSIKPELRDGAC